MPTVLSRAGQTDHELGRVGVVERALLELVLAERHPGDAARVEVVVVVVDVDVAGDAVVGAHRVLEGLRLVHALEPDALVAAGSVECVADPAVDELLLAGRGELLAAERHLALADPDRRQRVLRPPDLGVLELGAAPHRGAQRVGDDRRPGQVAGAHPVGLQLELPVAGLAFDRGLGAPDIEGADVFPGLTIEVRVAYLDPVRQRDLGPLHLEGRLAVLPRHVEGWRVGLLAGPVVAGEIVLEEVEVGRGFVLGDQRLAALGATDEGDGRADLAALGERLEALRGVEDVDPAVLLDFVVVEAHQGPLRDCRGHGAGEQGEHAEARGEQQGLAHRRSPPGGQGLESLRRDVATSRWRAPRDRRRR